MRLLLSAAVAALTTLVVASPATAAEYTLIPSQSSITVGFNVPLGGGAFLDLTPQVFGPPASNITTYSGSLFATVAGSSITFDGGSVFDADLGNGTPYAFPANPNGEEDNYGLQLIAPGAGAAFRDMIFTATGAGTIGDADNSGWGVVLTDGTLATDFAALGGPGFAENDLTGLGGSAASGVIGYSLVAGVETITLPVDFTFFDAGTATTQSYFGEIVAQRTIGVIPEPTSGLFLASLAMGAGAVVRRRRK